MNRPERLVYEQITPLWIFCAPVLIIAAIIALLGVMTWTGAVLVVAILAFPFAVRRRLEIERASGAILVSWVLSLSPAGPRLVLRELVHGLLSAYQHVHVLTVRISVKTASGTTVAMEHRVQLVGRVSGLVGLAVADPAQNAALGGLFEVFAFGDKAVALRVATQLARDLELPLREPPPSLIPGYVIS